jgi:hypothetical protein
MSSPRVESILSLAERLRVRAGRLAPTRSPERADLRLAVRYLKRLVAVYVANEAVLAKHPMDRIALQAESRLLLQMAGGGHE